MTDRDPIPTRAKWGLTLTFLIAGLCWGVGAAIAIGSTEDAGDGPPLGAVFIAFPAFAFLIGAVAASPKRRSSDGG